MDEGAGDPAKDTQENTITAERLRLKSRVPVLEEGGSSAAKLGDRAKTYNGAREDTVAAEFGKEEQASEGHERSSNGRTPEQALTNSETHDASITMSAAELPTDVTTLVNENTKDEEESTLGDQNRQTVKNEGDEATLTSKGDTPSEPEEKPAEKRQGDRSKEGGGKGTEKSEWLDILGNGLLMKKVRLYRKTSGCLFHVVQLLTVLTGQWTYFPNKAQV